VLIAGNWKMFKGPSEARSFVANLEPARGVDVVVCPPFVSLSAALTGRVPVYAQNVHWDDEGAYTGEVSAPMLQELGVTGVIVGHSERRQLFGETDETVGKRAAHALASGLNVIACVGELEGERDAGTTEAVLERQLSVLGPHPRLTIAYEPVWAIGTGRTATPEQAEEAQGFIKLLLDAPVLYGGSVKPENAASILAQPAVDGALVGGASLDASSFRAICDAASAVA
jgi:triosephosphate isomerase (TIM)